MSSIKYDTAVSRGRRAVTAQTKANWTLGDIAASVEPAYGEGTVQRLADDIGISYKTLLDYRRVSDAYPASDRSESSWTVHQVFASESDRFELVRGEWTVSKARAEVDRRNAKDDAGTDDAGTDDAGTDDYDTKLAKARAEVTRLEGELAKARAAVTKLEADAPKAATPKAATPKAATPKAAKLHAVAS